MAERYWDREKSFDDDLSSFMGDLESEQRLEKEAADEKRAQRMAGKGLAALVEHHHEAVPYFTEENP